MSRITQMFLPMLIKTGPRFVALLALITFEPYRSRRNVVFFRAIGHWILVSLHLRFLHWHFIIAMIFDWFLYVKCVQCNVRLTMNPPVSQQHFDCSSLVQKNQEWSSIH